MQPTDSTCWTVIRGAAAGSDVDREAFARRYTGVARAYLAARWRGTPHLASLDDAAQEFFLECFREGGALARADPQRSGGFRAYLYGVLRHVAMRYETGKPSAERRQQGLGTESGELLPADDTSVTRAFDRAWAAAIVRAAGERMAADAQSREARRRVELLRLRFDDGLPIRAIAERWHEDAARLHHEYARARGEFKRALHAVVADHHPGSRAEIETECRNLLSLLV